MKITPVPHGLDLLASDLVRSPELHMSTIYNSLYQRLEPKRYGGGDGPNPLMMAVGTAWEKHLEYLMHKAGMQVMRPDELMADMGKGQVAYSPDGLMDKGMTLVEYKVAFWMSSRDVPREPCSTFPPKFEKYVCQMQAYCYAMMINRAKLYVLFIQGTGKNPELLVWDIEFSTEELRTNWAALTNHAKREGLL